MKSNRVRIEWPRDWQTGFLSAAGFTSEHLLSHETLNKSESITVASSLCQHEWFGGCWGCISYESEVDSDELAHHVSGTAPHAQDHRRIRSPFLHVHPSTTVCPILPLILNTCPGPIPETCVSGNNQQPREKQVFHLPISLQR